jgi:hypothetical protein
MVTHDCPMFFYSTGLKKQIIIPSVTAQALDSAFEKHQPELWIFGHHHVNVDVTIKGTRFICLNELCLKRLDLDY